MYYDEKMKGIVVSGTNNIFSVECDDGILRSCSIKGKQLKLDESYYNPLAPGDIVYIEKDALDGTKGQIISLEPRRNKFSRWNVKGKKHQLLAANIDYLVLVTTPSEPPFRPRFIDRALVQAEYENIEPLIVCNKIDLPFDDLFSESVTTWQTLGYKVIHASAKTGDGLSQLSAMLAEKFSALVGQSGVGKSSLINALGKSEILRTGELSQKWQRGAHTTTKGTLCHISLDGEHTASIVDTPGIRRFMLHDIMAQDLAMYFREFEPLIGKCEFGMSCTHLTERGCRIREAVESGKISGSRYDSWQRISQELRTSSWMD